MIIDSRTSTGDIARDLLLGERDEIDRRLALVKEGISGLNQEIAEKHKRLKDLGETQVKLAADRDRLEGALADLEDARNRAIGRLA